MRIQAILRRTRQAAATVRSHTYEESEELVNGPFRLSMEGRCAFWFDTPIRLTELEFRFLWELCLARGRVLTHEELLTAVWGNHPSNSLNVLRVTLNRIRRKLAPLNVEPTLITNFSKVGYSMPDFSKSPYASIMQYMVRCYSYVMLTFSILYRSLSMTIISKENNRLLKSLRQSYVSILYSP